jgi:16S rRNA (cytosine967-C5)-methyltransferase
MDKAGVRNVQFHSDERKLETAAKGKIDWLILDVPCTGTGTLRRNPDIKLKFSMEWLRYNIRTQENIV